MNLLSKLLCILLLCLSTSCAEFRPSWIDGVIEDDKVQITPGDFDGPLGGRFDNEGNWIPDDPTIEATYRIPDISAGFLFDIATLDLAPSLQVEIFEFDIPGYFFSNSFLRYIRTWKFDAGVAYQRAFVYLGPRLTSIFEISAGGFIGWNWDDEQLSYGIGFTIIKF